MQRRFASSSSKSRIHVCYPELCPHMQPSRTRYAKQLPKQGHVSMRPPPTTNPKALSIPGVMLRALYSDIIGTIQLLMNRGSI